MEADKKSSSKLCFPQNRRPSSYICLIICGSCIFVFAEKYTCHICTAMVQVGDCCVKGVCVYGEVRGGLTVEKHGCAFKKQNQTTDKCIEEEKNTTIILQGSLYVLCGSLNSVILWLWPSLLLWPLCCHSLIGLGEHITHFDGVFFSLGALAFPPNFKQFKDGHSPRCLTGLPLESNKVPHSLTPKWCRVPGCSLTLG